LVILNDFKNLFTYSFKLKKFLCENLRLPDELAKLIIIDADFKSKAN